MAAGKEYVLKVACDIYPRDGSGEPYTLPAGTVLIMPPGQDRTPKHERTVWHNS